MVLNENQILHLGRLARIRLEEGDLTALAGQFEGILGLIDRLQAVDTSGVEPLAHPLEARQPLREDRVTERDQRTLFQSLAPQAEKGLYLVPRVIE